MCKQRQIAQYLWIQSLPEVSNQLQGINLEILHCESGSLNNQQFVEVAQVIKYCSVYKTNTMSIIC